MEIPYTVVAVSGVEILVIFFLVSGVHGSPEYVFIENTYERDPAPESINQGEYVITALGDSHTAGQFENKSLAWPNQLEKSLREKYSRDVEVLNIAHTGLGLASKVDRYRKFNASPDLLVLQVSYDDPLNRSAYKEEIREKLGENPDLDNSSVGSKKLEIRRDLKKKYAKRWRSIYREQFNRLQESVSGDTRVVVLHFKVKESRIAPVKEMVERRGWTYLDWSGYYRGRVDSVRKLWISESDPHHNPKGHDIWGEELARYLVENGLVDQPGPGQYTP